MGTRVFQQVAAIGNYSVSLCIFPEIRSLAEVAPGIDWTRIMKARDRIRRIEEDKLYAIPSNS